MNEETSLIHQSAKAEENKEAIIQAKMNVAANYLILARLLNESHRDSLYKLLGCDSFDEFLGMPEIGFKRSTAYNLIKVWKLYKEKLDVDDHTMLDVGHTKLLKIAPVVESNKDEWLSKARTLSVSDLGIEIAGVSGKDTKTLPTLPPPSPAPPSSCCCCCGAKEWERHHFPVTRGAGAPDHWWIPLCRVCHSEYHQNPVEWTTTYKRKWAKYLYDDRKGE